MQIARRFTSETTAESRANGTAPYSLLEFASRRSEIRNPDGSLVFEADEVKVPANWSALARDVPGISSTACTATPRKFRRCTRSG